MVEIRTGESSVRATAYHPFWVIDGFDLENRPRPKRLAEDEDEGHGLPGRWVNSHDLLPGDILATATGERVQVDSIEQTLATDPTPVVNLTIDANPNFSVGTAQLLVHNTSPCDEARRSIVQTNKAAGNAIRDVIAAREAPALIEQSFRTVGGMRRVDVLKLGDDLVAIESKVGRTALSGRVRQELARDWWLLRQNKVQQVVWEFSRSDVTGKIGPTKALLEKLRKLGIDVVIND